MACKEAANENDETRKRFEVMCREVFRKFRACINMQGVNDHRAERNAIDIVYKSLQRDREQADISDIIRKLHEVVDEAIDVRPNAQAEKQAPYDIGRIDFDRLKCEFERSAGKHTTVQALKDAVEKKLRRLLAENPLRTDFQRHYEEIVAEYNREKDRVTIERTFEALLKLVQELDDEESRAVREGLDEESLAIFDLLKKPDLSGSEIRRIKQVAVELLRTLKAEKLRVDQWREKESTRDAVQVAIHDFLYSDETGLPADSLLGRRRSRSSPTTCTGTCSGRTRRCRRRTTSARRRPDARRVEFPAPPQTWTAWHGFGSRKARRSLERTLPAPTSVLIHLRLGVVVGESDAHHPRRLPRCRGA